MVEKMSSAKNKLAKQEEMHENAIGLCLEVGAIKACPDHPGEYIDSQEFEDHEELADLILEENPDAIEQFEDRDEMVEQIRDAMASAGESCAKCEDEVS